MAELEIDRLVLILVSRSQSKKLMAHLNNRGFFHETTILLLLGLNQSRQETLNNLVKKYCRPQKKFIPVQMRASSELSHLPVIEAIVGGATLYQIPVEHFEQV